ncbi:MAG: hypothetical protein GY711_09310 [bacterium]|nr:hypothetical protein [bacterium]
MWRFARDGSLISSWSAGSRVGNLVVAADGTVWLSRVDGSIRNYSQDGTLLSDFSTPYTAQTFGLDTAPDGTLWVSSNWHPTVFHYDTTGNVLGSFVYGDQSAFLTVGKSGIGTRYCSPAVTNSSGLPSRISATGSALVANNDLTLIADDLPAGEFGYFLVGSNQGTASPPESDGVLCLACGFQGCSGIGRYSRPGEIIQGPSGMLPIDLTALPLTPLHAVVPGETWNFQLWHRDLGSSNFTDAIAISFL